MDHVGHFIDNASIDGPEDTRSPVYNPSTGAIERTVGLATPAMLDRALESSLRGAKAWSATSLSKRAEVLFSFRQLVADNADTLAEAVAIEHGKTLADAAGEVARGLENIEFATGLMTLLKGSHAGEVSTGIDVRAERYPVGIVAGITPFNFPAMVPLWMAANALACGNAFLLKPSEKDPSASLLLANLGAEAGLPPGAFNVLHGGAEIVGSLLEDPRINAISFVGSTPVARSIFQRGTASGKRVQALGGAKNHMVVLPDAEIDGAADAAISAAYGSAGERCMAVSVVVALGDIADALVSAIASRMAALRIGPSLDPNSEMGPLVTQEHRDRVAGYIDIAASEGASVVVDGRKHLLQEGSASGFFLGPSLIDHVDASMQVYRDEIFGPVLCVVRAKTFDEAVAIVNANPYGNGVAIFTRDGGAARRFERSVEVGMVGVNVPVPVPVASFSFGGWKDSLFGDSHIYGPSGIDFYTRWKVTTSRWPDPGSSSIDLGFPQTR
ncbi:MAG: CoA-acylating methylmalonate-semialdehyde dehydrogenase [Actinomycetota bacterium]